MPRWLPAAAALLLLGGGVIWAANRTGGGSFDETAATGESSDAASDAAASKEGGGTEAAEADSMMAAEAPDEETLAQDSAAAGSDAPADESTARSTAPANGGFFRRDPVASFPQLPDADAILVGLPEPWPDLSQSLCGGELDLRPELDVIGYLPIEVGGRPVELFVAADAAGVQTPFVLDEACVQILP